MKNANKDRQIVRDVKQSVQTLVYLSLMMNQVQTFSNCWGCEIISLNSFISESDDKPVYKHIQIVWDVKQ